MTNLHEQTEALAKQLMESHSRGDIRAAVFIAVTPQGEVSQCGVGDRLETAGLIAVGQVRFAMMHAAGGFSKEVEE